METTSVESIVMELVVNGGDARSKALEAIMAAKEGDFELAEKNLKESKESLIKAHNFQTSLIQKEMAEQKQEPVSLIMVHGQDHLMNAMTVRDLAAEMVDMYRIIKK